MTIKYEFKVNGQVINSFEGFDYQSFMQYFDKLVRLNPGKLVTLTRTNKSVFEKERRIPAGLKQENTWEETLWDSTRF